MDWTPLHQSHSIEVAGAAANFAEPMTDLSWRKTVREAEAVCKAAGLSEQSTMNGIQIVVGPGNMAPPVPTPIDTIVFNRFATIDVPGVGLQKAMAESLSVSRLGLTYQTTAYTRWEAFRDRLAMVLRAPLKSALHVVTTANLRLEYKDQFRFSGDPAAPIAAALLNRSSPLIAPHVFEAQKLWHSHTGFFEDAEGCQSRLIQINIDSNDIVALGDHSPVRAVSISTGVQNNFAATSDAPLVSEDQQAKFQIEMFDSLHDRSIELFKQIISKEAAARVGIK